MDQLETPQPDVAALERNLERLLRERRPPPLLPGSQLAKLINDALGEGMSFRGYFPASEVPRLQTFVDRYIPKRLVQFTGEKQGADNMFSIPAEASAVELAPDGSMWKSFVAVSPTNTLVFDSKTASVAVLSQNLPIPEECVVIKPIALEEHRQLIQAFCVSLEEDGVETAALRAIAEGPPDGLYQNWLAALRSRKPLDRKWGQFRRDRVLEMFEGRMLDAGANVERAEQLRRQLEAAHEVARAPKAVAAASLVAHVASGSPVSTPEHREKRARELLKAAAERLSIKQLLSIQLPIGVLLDITGHTDGKE